MVISGMERIGKKEKIDCETVTILNIGSQRLKTIGGATEGLRHYYRNEVGKSLDFGNRK